MNFYHLLKSKNRRGGFTLLELIIAVVILAVLATIAIPTFLQDITNSKSAVAAESAAAIARDAEGMNSSNPNPDGSVNSVTLSNLIAATGEASGSYISTATGFEYDATNGTSACVVFSGTGANQQFTVTKGACAGGGGGPTTTTAPTTTTTVPSPILATIAVTDPVAGCSDGTDAWVVTTAYDDVTPGTVQEIDIATSTVVATVTVGVNPQSVACYGGNVWVGGNYPDQDVTEINAATATVTNTFPVTGSPSAIYADATGVWVTSGVGVGTVQLDATTGAVLNTFATGDGGGNGSRAIVGNGTDVWVSNSNTGTITEINEATSTVVTTWSTPGAYHDMALSGSDLWITDFFDHAVYEYTTSGTLLKTISGGQPYSVAINGNDVWVANDSGAVATEIDATTGATLQTVSLPNQPMGIFADSSSIWATAYNTDVVQLTP
jgi:prepilin-type N-terminal cleavage/methylation domain-containing protein